MNIDNTTLYSLEEIINNVPLPVIVRKPNWTNSFTFRVERIQNGVAYGTSFRNGVEHHRLFGEYSYRLFEKFYYVSSVRYNSIEELFSAKETELFNEVFLKSLYDVKFSNTDNGVFEQCEMYLREFLKLYGIDLDNEDRAHVRECLIKSPCCKKYSELLEQNLEFFTAERSYISWDRRETKVTVILDAIVQASIQNSRPLTRQYARILASRYYVLDHSNDSISSETLYKTLFVFLSDKEFNAWIINDATCFERIVKKAASRIKKCLVRDVDEQILVSQLIQTPKFRDASQRYPFLIDSARTGKYKPFIDAIFAKAPEPKEIEKKVKNEVASPQPVPVVQVDNRTGLERLLSLAKKSSQDEPSQFADFWNSIEAELKESETFERVSKVDYSYTLGDYDDDVMYLMY